MPKVPKQRQRTLLEFVGSSSPAKHSIPSTGRRPIAESDDSASDPGKIKFEREQGVSSGSKDQTDAGEDDEPHPPRRSARIQTARKDVSPSISSARSTTPERAATWKMNQFSRKKRLVITSDESDNQKPTKKRRLVKGKRPHSTPEDDEDEDPESEVDKDRILASRLRGRPKKTDFVRNLERLQRRRRGEASPSEDEESGGDDSGSSCSRDTSLQIFQGARPTIKEEDDMAENVSFEDDHDNFIVQDDGDNVPELPAIFSMGTYQDLSHHFKVICQLFVHLTVMKHTQRRSFMEKAMKRNVFADDYFSVPLAIVRRKFSAMKDSLVTSSIWKTDFKAPLESLPDFRLESLDFSIPLCDACGLGSRVATLRGIIGGRKYDRLTFEPLEDIMGIDQDQSGEIEWNLGRFCAARAQVFHLFSHWEFILYHSLREEVERLQDALTRSGAEKSRVFLPATQGPSAPDDPNDADGIMDWLDGRGVVNLQWANVKSMMDRARKLEKGKEAEADIDIM